MKIEKLISNKDGLSLELAIFEPEGAPVGIVQLVHGMAEHKERYFDFMNYLAEHGFVCAISDHRGHGASVRDPKHLGYFYTEDISYIVDDSYQVTEHIKNKYPNLDLCLFSHSMGTLVARNYLKKYESQVDKVVLCGPPTQNPIVDLAIVLAKLSKIFYGPYAPNGFLNKIAMEPSNKGFEVKNSWICSDPEVVANYNADPLSGFIFTTNGFINLFKLMKESFNDRDWKVENADLPIFLMAGAEDPVIQSKEKFAELAKFLEDLGYRNVTAKLYLGKRHELLNEVDKQAVYEDVLEFILNG